MSVSTVEMATANQQNAPSFIDFLQRKMNKLKEKHSVRHIHPKPTPNLKPTLTNLAQQTHIDYDNVHPLNI